MTSRPSAGRPAARMAAGALPVVLPVMLAGTLLAGCAGQEAAGGASVPPPTSRAVPTWDGRAVPSAAPAATPLVFAPPLPRSVPVSITIPRLGVSAPVSRLGLRRDGTIEEPPLSEPNLTGWYEEGPTPGEAGPSVILGHVDANRRAAVFHRLGELRPGDRIEVTRRDGSVAVFAVQRLVRVAKDRFPGELIYAEDIDYSALRLVTCGGAFDSRSGHYVDNVIAFTRLVT
ncbi:Sortase family protein [Thermomonospora echinospora]|uniref:Sortase family protein n=1 Tax=Thermomonospora echinospora TaxID=1992 RepID=A0A1H5XEN1_9ACTN|nr:class F sortase [Thermomonospora echinospora]SEG10103.1 Sortase family protein [Thermomonospora echinospora]